MGIAMQHLKSMEAQGLFRPGARILDIGSSRLCGADAQDIARFIHKYRPAADKEEVNALAQRLAAESTYVPGGEAPKACIGEMFEAAGMEYLAFDVAQSHHAHPLDMNVEDLPSDYRSHFDLVLNFGTTQHLFNQLNSFKIIHEATRSGGHIVHQLPTIGFTHQSYVTYTGRFFFDLANFNDYEIVDFAFTGPVGETDLFEPVNNYAHQFPLLQRGAPTAGNDGSDLRDVRLPNVAIRVTYHKCHDHPFMAALECQTSVGNIPESIVAAYGKSGGVVTRLRKRNLLVRGLRKAARMLKLSA